MTKIQSTVQNICASLLHASIHQSGVRGEDAIEMKQAVKEITSTISQLTLGQNMYAGILPAIDQNELTDNLLLSNAMLIRTLNQTGFNVTESEILEGIEAATNELRNGVDMALGKLRVVREERAS